MFVDSDDLIAPTHVDALMTALRAGDCDYVTSDYTDIDEAGNHIGRGKPREFMGTAWGRAYWRYVWEDVRFPEGYLYEDTMLSFLVKPRYANKQIEDNGYLYRHTKSSISRSKGNDAKCIDTYWIIEELLHDCCKASVPFDQRLYDTTIHHLGQLIYWRTRNCPPEQQQILFSACCDLLGSIPEFARMQTTLVGYEKDVEQSLRTGNYRLWKASCLFLNLQTL